MYLNVTNLERSLEFYTGVIGLQELERTEVKAVLTADGKTPLVQLEQPENVTAIEPRRSGLFHFAILVPTRADLGRILNHFIERNVQLGASDHIVSEALYLSDPDGNGIEVYVDRHPDEWQWENGHVVMRTDPLQYEDVLAAGGAGSWEGMPVGTIMGHIHLHVADLQEAETFYKTLGFEVVSHYPQALFMSNGKYHHHIAVNTWNGAGAPRPSALSAGMRAYTLIYPDEETLLASIDQVQEAGNEVKPVSNGYCVEDPSGNQILLRL
ncbi:VOC family protein [Sporosarcina sp. 179-K 3D1 HS]